jgi:hypothetical protein
MRHAVPDGRFGAVFDARMEFSSSRRFAFPNADRRDVLVY